MKEYDIFLPLYYNDGTPVEARKFQDVQQASLDHFGGLTFFPQPNQGFWAIGNVTYRDEIVIYRVLTTKPRASRRFLADLKKDLRKKFRQEEILIIERDIATI